MRQTTISPELLALDSLAVYRGLLEDPVLRRLRELLAALEKENLQVREIVNFYHDFYYELAKCPQLSLSNHILDQIIFAENSFSFKAQAINTPVLESTLERAAARDLRNLQSVAKLDGSALKAGISARFHPGVQERKEGPGLDPTLELLLQELPEWEVSPLPSAEDEPEHLHNLKETFLKARHWDDCLPELRQFHRQYGCGLFARSIAFIWERYEGQGFLKSVARPDPITLNELVDYQDERSKILENTLQFLKGYPANNVLLYGDRGTGKSSTVKAILNAYHSRGLRMIEVPKAFLADFPQIIRLLTNRAQKFILFVDDLVFGDNEENYTSLKAVLEGGLESKTSNILIYATSNRRHLVKEYFSERAGLHSGNRDEEVHAGDSMQEKLSLADRFGINVVFSSPDQKQYLKIVEGIASQRQLSIEQSVLHKEALQWALWYNGRSARTARQFVDWLEGHLALN
ncbi:ATP-binding protein [Desulfosporosinus sp. PR]|uniref:ATP-binding protein n=1 Tax=Candidatus Desulfosporosinus nitrosoreducens TaxID=3401928 RepID=UPI0027FE7E2F|nr:ATP-binding protein [Desulfosporosinus sp. PR]MDQ7094437.1 ATP-binding protein [Desulfosporosinus sp. PR]